MMKGKSIFVNAKTGPIKVGVKMIVFTPAGDALWEKFIAAAQYPTIEINGMKHIYGPIRDVEEFFMSDLNDESKLLAVELDGKWLRLNNSTVNHLMSRGRIQTEEEFYIVEGEGENYAILDPW